jgi:hypothetical protein
MVVAVTDFNVEAVDSLMLCEDGAECVLVGSLRQRPDTSFWTFGNCTDGLKNVNVTVWADGKAATASASIVLDTKEPILNWLDLYDLSSGDHTYTDSLVIGVEYSALDQPLERLQWLVLAENPAFVRPDTIDVSLTHGNVQFEVSPGFERKTVYGYLIDRAENASTVRSDSIMLFEHAHNYPNPFNPAVEHTNLVFTSLREQRVTILIYDLFGNLVFEREAMASAGLNDGAVEASWQWDGRNTAGLPVADGGYVCLIKAADGQQSRHKIAVIR